MTTQVRAALTVVLLLGGAPLTAIAGPCDAYFTFDDTLADAGPNGYDGEMIGAEGASTQTTYTEGKFGKALVLDGNAAMRALIDLHYDSCPQFTISAWIKVSRDASAAPVLFSTGSGNTPGMNFSTSSLTLRGTENGIYQPNVVRPESWMFVAGVYNYETAVYELYWGSRPPTPGKLSPDRGDPQNAFWIGTEHDDWGNFADGVAVDDLRITGQALAPEQVAKLRTMPPASLVDNQAAPDSSNSTPTESGLPACDVQDDCATDSYCAFDNTCHPGSHLPKQELEILAAPGGSGIDPSTVVFGEGARSETVVPLDDLHDTAPDYFPGTWCVHPSADVSSDLRHMRTIYLAASRSGGSNGELDFEDRRAPGVRQEGRNWGWNTYGSGEDGLTIVTPLSSTLYGVFIATLSSATAQRFFADVRSAGSVVFVRGECSDAETFPAETLLPEYFLVRAHGALRSRRSPASHRGRIACTSSCPTVQPEAVVSRMANGPGIRPANS